MLVKRDSIIDLVLRPFRFAYRRIKRGTWTLYYVWFDNRRLLTSGPAKIQTRGRRSPIPPLEFVSALIVLAGAAEAFFFNDLPFELPAGGHQVGAVLDLIPFGTAASSIGIFVGFIAVPWLVSHSLGWTVPFRAYFAATAYEGGIIAPMIVTVFLLNAAANRWDLAWLSYIAIVLYFIAPFYGFFWVGRQLQQEGHPLLGLAAGAALTVASISVAISNHVWPKATFEAVLSDMAPSLVPGDVAVFNQWAPLWREPRRGEIIVFSSGDGIGALRVLGLPGDRVQLRDGRVFINGRAIAQVRRRPYRLNVRTANECPTLFADARLENEAGRLICLMDVVTEVQQDGRSYDVLDAGPSALDNTQEVVVPTGRYFLLADNRDWARDTRGDVIQEGPGFVSRSAILGYLYGRIYPNGQSL